MAGFVTYLAPVAVFAVAIVLFAGFFNMARGGEGAPERSQSLMRWRVGLQFFALLVLVAVLLLSGR